MLENTVTTFVQSKEGRKLSSRRVLFHLPERLFGYSTYSKEVLQTKLSPISVALCPTPFCVRNCLFCSNHNRNKENIAQKNEIAPKKFIRLINDLSCLDVKGVTIAGGGDPLAYKGLVIDGLILGKNLSFKIGLHTNCVLLDEDVAEKILASGNLAYVNISVVAHTSKLYKKICGYREQFYKVENNIIEAIKIKSLVKSDALVGVKILLCRENFEFFDDIFSYKMLDMRFAIYRRS